MAPTRNQFFAPGELPLVLLAVLANQPRHGYELMTELDRLFAPAYSSSAGSVYPAIAALAEEGLIVAESTGARKVYRPTASGRSALAKRRSTLAAIEVRTGARLYPDGGLDGPLERFVKRVGELSGRVDPDKVEQVLDEAATAIEALDAKGATHARGR
ncbi:MAG TPA: PadR family transcriptional regulator [Acidimicrobiales bacterium]|nr:PadR family transcriptional regulator [Acidimicrobiales bacterium]